METDVMYLITNLSDPSAAPETKRTREGAIFRGWTIMTGPFDARVRIEHSTTGEVIEGERIAHLAATLPVTGPFD